VKLKRAMLLTTIRQILNSIWQRKHRRTGHVLRNDGLLQEIIEGRMWGKPTRWRRRFHMLHDLANDGGFVALKRTAEEREGWRHRERKSKTCCTAEDYWWWTISRIRLKVNTRHLEKRLLGGYRNPTHRYNLPFPELCWNSSEHWGGWLPLLTPTWTSSLWCSLLSTVTLQLSLHRNPRTFGLLEASLTSSNPCWMWRNRQANLMV